MKSPNDFIQEFSHKAFAEATALGVQCVFGFKKFCNWIGIPYWQTLSGWADGFWDFRMKQDLAVQNFDFIEKISDVKEGDWCIWRYGSGSADTPESHIAMYVRDGIYNKGVFFGQRQGTLNCEGLDKSFEGFCMAEISWKGFLGAFRWKAWNVSIPEGESEYSSGSRNYLLCRQRSGWSAGVFGAGLNQCKTIKELDADGVTIYAKATGANFFINNSADPNYRMTLGPISAPFNHEFQNIPNQNTTLYYDLTTGAYGKCSEGIEIKHHVFSPCIIFHDNTFEYADGLIPMTRVDEGRRFTFVLQTTSGDYILGLPRQEQTPREAWNDFRFIGKTMCILDGGGSAKLQIGYNVHTATSEDRPVPSCVAFYVPDEEPDGAGGTQQMRDIDELKKTVEILTAENVSLMRKLSERDDVIEQIRAVLPERT